MARLVLFAVLAFPFLEIAGFIWVGGRIGVLATLAAIIASAVLGLLILRRQGLGMLMDSQTMLARGELPTQQFFEMMVMAVAGLLLLIPGFFSDIVAFALLIPPLRGWLYRSLSRNMVVVTSYRPSGGGPGMRSIDLDPDDYR
ncbi:MAG TPA: FxsA family protein [Pelagibacterium sp.]|uniref:FxsA family protein n=1 Tax=Pelagibacterium sp. TaxID=1967288 RepID=UPI002B5E975C|nr:FxsA family protein [Pelagibacterium sp.]HWJ88183.1 FxsA family protein [Pelagibacterium sp.]